MSHITNLGARSLCDLVANRELSCLEIVRAHLDKVAILNPTLNALLTVDAEGAEAAARDMDRRIERGEAPPPLAGVPVVVKDNLCTRGLKTTCGSKILCGYTPPYDATAVARLRAAGAILLGKSNLDEFAMGSSTENSAFGVTRNPWDTARVPGGSSGGSAAAVAARMAPIALGTDTGGSIKQPAAFCGVVGMRPTYGRVSRYGLVAFASSLDQVGPIARSVEDALLLLAAISGADPKDATCGDLPPLPAELPPEDMKGLRVGMVREHFGDAVDREVRSAVSGAAGYLEKAGAQVREVSLPNSGRALAAYCVLATAEASSNLARYDGVRYGGRLDGGSAAAACERTRTALFGPEVKRRILLGTFVLSEGYREAYYLRAQETRNLVAADFAKAFGEVDMLLGPTAPTAAFPIGEKVQDPISMYLSDIFTVPSSLGGFPGLSVPCGFTEAGLPVGVQIVGRHFEELSLFRAGAVIERTLGLTARPPTLGAP